MSTDGQKWLVDLFIAEGDTSMLVGKPARGMSWLPTYMAISLVSTIEDVSTPMLEREAGNEVSNAD